MKKSGTRTFGQEGQRLTWRLRLGKFEVGATRKTHTEQDRDLGMGCERDETRRGSRNLPRGSCGVEYQ